MTEEGPANPGRQPFGDVVRERGLSLRDVAYGLDVKYIVVTQCKGGFVWPRRAFVERMLALFPECEPEELFTPAVLSRYGISPRRELASAEAEASS